jgi:putative oxidoreductase
MFTQLLASMNNLIATGNRTGYWVSAFVLRLLLAVEFYASGIEKLRGENWFGDIQSQFPFPFNVIPPDISWNLAIVFEIGGAIALVLGIGTRFFALSLMVLTVVATAAVHWPESWSTFSELAQGYVITDHGHGNFKLPLIYLVMFVPLLLNGPGRASIDYWVVRRFAPMHQ